jgi:hypothetical protein
MALLEDALGGWSGILIGVGAAVVVPSLLPAIGSGVRPLAKALVKGSLFLSDQVTALAAGTRKQVGSLVAEVQTEGGRPKSATPREPKVIRP